MPRLRLLPKVEAVMKPEQVAPVLEYLLRRGQPIGIDTETTGLNKLDDTVLFWSMATEDRRFFFPWELLDLFEPLFKRQDQRWYLANAKYDAHLLANMGANLKGELWDIVVMDAMDDDTRSHRLKSQAFMHFGVRWNEFKDTFLNPARVAETLGLDRKSFTDFKKKSVGDALLYVYDERPDIVENYATCDAYFTYLLAEHHIKSLSSTQSPTEVVDCIQNQFDYFTQIEVPLTRTLFNMERRGVKADLERAKEIEGPMLDGLAAAQANIDRLLGRGNFDPHKKDELRHILFDPSEFGLKPIKNTGVKAGVATSKSTPLASVDSKDLEILAERCGPTSLPGMFLAAYSKWAKIEKLYGTYVRDLDQSVSKKTGLVHANFNQAVARTSRLSCVASWTPIRTSRGMVPVGGVVVGDLVWTHKGRWRRVLAAFTKGVERMYDVHLSNGQVMTCTADHRLLMANGAWRRVGDLNNELFQGVGAETRESDQGGESVPRKGDPHDRTDCRSTGDALPQCGQGLTDRYAGGGASRPGESPVLGLKDRREESHDWEDREGAPQLDRRGRGRLRVPDLSPPGEAAVRASCGGRADAGDRQNPHEARGASHRQQPQEQLSGQLGDRNERRSSAHSLFSGEGLDPVEIKEINYRGRLEVHDLTVEEDESYEACGVLSHNSSDPNLQNLPARNDDYGLRSIFCALPGHLLISRDYPQIEFRVAAVLAGEEGMLADIRAGWDIHSANAARMYGVKHPGVTYEAIEEARAKKGRKEPLSALDYLCIRCRDGAKVVGLGTLYGQGAYRISISLGCSKDEAQADIDAFFENNPKIADLITFMHDLAHAEGYSHTWLGRMRRLHQVANHFNAGVVAAEERQAFNMLIQGSSAEMIKLAMILIDTDKEFAQMGAGLLISVHDELIGQAPEGIVKDAARLMEKHMNNPYNLGGIQLTFGVPIPPDGGEGFRWTDIK